MATGSPSDWPKESMTRYSKTTIETCPADFEPEVGLVDSTRIPSSGFARIGNLQKTLTLSSLPSLVFRHLHATGKSTILRSRVQERIFTASTFRRELKLRETVSPKLLRHRKTREAIKQSAAFGGTFEYLPLDSPTHVRVFELHPGSGKTPLQGTFSVNELAQLEDFEAISHAWGTLVKDEALWCGTGYVFVTSAMLEMLRFLRDPVRRRSIWIDYVCSNQADKDERASQVLLMPQLYGSASKVIIWLGNENEDTSHAFDIMLAAYKAMNCTEQLDGSPQSYENLLENGLPDRTDKRWAYFEDLVHRLWFTRTWTVPEVCLAQEAVMMCGRYTCPWLVLECVVLRMRYSNIDDVVGVNLWTAASVAFIANNVRKLRSSTLLDLLIVMASKNASDARDKVYAILGLASDRLKVEASIRVSYKDDYGADDLSLAIAESYLTRGDMSALNAARYPCLRTNPRLPSWVLDFSTHNPVSPLLLWLRQSRGSHTCQKQCKYPQILPDGKTLRIRVIPLTIIRTVGKRFPSIAIARINFVAICHFEQWRYLARKAQPDVPRAVVDEIFARTLVFDTMDASTLGFASFAELHQAHIDSCRKYTAPGQARNEQPVIRYYQLCSSQTCQHRTFFILKDGRFGLGPYFARPGDVVMKVHGAETLFVLRKKKTGQYLLVGEAYIHNEMDPEDCGSDKYEEIDVV